MTAPTFTFTGELEFTNWRGRERLADFTATYRYDGAGQPEFVSGHAHSDESEAEAEFDRIIDDIIDDRCDDDFADWLADQDDDFLPTASESTVPGAVA